MADAGVQSSIASGYRIPSGSCDELLAPDGTALPHAAPLMAALARLGPEALNAAGKRRDTIFMQQGITFEVAGTDGQRKGARMVGDAERLGTQLEPSFNIFFRQPGMPGGNLAE
jgi:hypothetical protein